MTQFGNVFAIKASRVTPDQADPVLDLNRIRTNQEQGRVSSFIPDQNVMIDVDSACGVDEPATDETLEKYGLLEWVNFLKQCDCQGLQYSLSPFFAFNEMPRKLAQERASRHNEFSKKFGLNWIDDGPDHPAYSELGRGAPTFESLDHTEQCLMGISFAALLLMLVIQRDGGEFSPVGKFRRYVSEYKRHIGVVSVRELAIARYVFATPNDCLGELDYVRSRIVKNFAKKGDKYPKTWQEMEAIALNGASDLLLFTGMNIAESKGIEGRPHDCWLFTKDQKLREYNELCFNTSFGTDQVGLFTVHQKHTELSDYWINTLGALQSVTSAGARRVMKRMTRDLLGQKDPDEIQKKIFEFPSKARAILQLAEHGLRYQFPISI